MSVESVGRIAFIGVVNIFWRHCISKWVVQVCDVMAQFVFCTTLMRTNNCKNIVVA